MRADLNKLDSFRKWFEQYVEKGYGKKCGEFVWNCASCRANFVSEVLSDFIQSEVDTEQWLLKQKEEHKKRSRPKRVKIKK